MRPYKVCFLSQCSKNGFSQLKWVSSICLLAEQRLEKCYTHKNVCTPIGLCADMMVSHTVQSIATIGSFNSTVFSGIGLVHCVRICHVIYEWLLPKSQCTNAISGILFQSQCHFIAFFLASFSYIFDFLNIFLVVCLQYAITLDSRIINESGMVWWDPKVLISSHGA